VVFELSYVTGSYVIRVRGSWQAKDSIVGRVLYGARGNGGGRFELFGDGHLCTVGSCRFSGSSDFGVCNAFFSGQS